MKALNKLIMLCFLFLLCSCAGLTRGVYDGVFVSTAKPAFSVSVPSLALLTSGNVTPLVTTGESLGGVSVNSELAVYGGPSPTSPMAVVMHSQAPSGWYWDSDLSAIFSIDKGVAFMGPFSMQTCTYIVKGEHDAFVGLSKVADPEKSLWLARRFAVRADFDHGKLTLEYREPLPANIPAGITDLQSLPFADVDAIRAFEKRAEAAFVVVPEAVASNLPTVYPQGVRTRYINNNFLGTLSAYSTLDK